jgi:hypothetical protein
LIKAKNPCFHPPKISVFPDIFLRNFRVFFIQPSDRSACGKKNHYGFVGFRKISKPYIVIQPGRNDPMKTRKIRREIVAVFMESPLYFSIPLKKRLEFILFFSQQPVYNNFSELNNPHSGKSLHKSAWSKLIN